MRFVECENGLFKVWEYPSFRASHRYVVSVDVGGRSNSADYSVISVIDRWWRTEGEGDVIVAQWRGHCRHDILAWKMAQIAKYYNDALLVVEANTYETKENDTEGDHTEYILAQIGEAYTNMYAREAPQDVIKDGSATRWGFHTNTKTKNLIIDNLVTLIDEHGYIERDEDILVEFNAYNREETK